MGSGVVRLTDDATAGYHTTMSKPHRMRWHPPPLAILLGSLLLIPAPPSHWQTDSYDHIPANRVEIDPQGMTIVIDHSAGPVIYPFKAVTAITGFSIDGRFNGLPQLENTSQQGRKGADDFPLRIGFVIAGKARLNVFQRLIAPDWIKHLHDMAPRNIGLDHVRFFTVTQNPKLVGQSRTHPDSDIVQEIFFATVATPGPYHFRKTFDIPLNTIAVWISSDGDDTGSRYSVEINRLELKTRRNTPRHMPKNGNEDLN